MRLYNTLKRAKQDFESLREGKVSMYVCGVTVYDECHLGHARAYVSFDVLRRYLQYKGYCVRYVQNFTDIDDKIIARAQEQGAEDMAQAVKDVSEHFIERYFDVMDALGVLRADEYPKATEHIEDMIAMIVSLIERGHAYDVDGEIFFAVNTFESYGKLSGKQLDDLQVGQRVDVDVRKKNPLDFVLWKAHKPGEPAWKSPWGLGRPGWHIECSAMSRKHLDGTFDIHGGGVDLIFPHHENEIAQSEACTGECFARYWMHNGFLTINQEKMSKSLGNFFTLKDIYEQYAPEVVRMFLLTSHYRSPMDFSDERLAEAKEQCYRCYMMLKNAGLAITGETASVWTDEMQVIKDKWLAGMDDDINTALAIGCLFEIVHEANVYMKEGVQTEDQRQELKGWLNLFEEIARVMHLFLNPYRVVSETSPTSDDVEREIQQLLLERKQARTEKDWGSADVLRERLLALYDDIELEDTPQGSLVSFRL